MKFALAFMLLFTTVIASAYPLTPVIAVTDKVAINKFMVDLAYDYEDSNGEVIYRHKPDADLCVVINPARLECSMNYVANAREGFVKVAFKIESGNLTQVLDEEVSSNY